jgi:hypothetical protein
MKELSPFQHPELCLRMNKDRVFRHRRIAKNCVIQIDEVNNTGSRLFPYPCALTLERLKITRSSVSALQDKVAAGKGSELISF